MLHDVLYPFLVAVVVGLIAYLVAKVVPFFRGRENQVGLGAFVVVIVLYLVANIS